MTQNQIAFAKLVEERRHNVAGEAETVRHNIEDEGIRYSANAIQRAMNKITGQHYTRMDKETRRHDKAGERISNKQIAESRRHSKETESISKFQSVEQKRHNIAMENVDWANVSIGRSNAASNAVQAQAATRNAAASEKNAYANMFNAQTRSDELDLSRDRYTLDQWERSETVPKQREKLEAERDLTRAKQEYQETQNQYYLLDKVDNAINSLGMLSPAGDAPTVPKTKSPKRRTK